MSASAVALLMALRTCLQVRTKLVVLDVLLITYFVLSLLVYMRCYMHHSMLSYHIDRAYQVTTHNTVTKKWHQQRCIILLHTRLIVL